MPTATTYYREAQVLVLLVGLISLGCGLDAAWTSWNLGYPEFSWKKMTCHGALAAALIALHIAAGIALMVSVARHWKKSAH